MIFSKCDRHLKSHDFDFALTDADLAHSLPTSLADGQSYYVHTCEVRGHTVARTCLFLGGLWVAFAPAPSQEKSAWTLRALASSGPVGWAAPHSSAAMWGKLHVSPGVLPAVSTHLPGLRGDQGHVCCVLRGGLAAGSAPVGQAVRRPWALSPPNHRFLPD